MWLKKVKSFLNDVEIERIRLTCFEILGPDVQVSISEVSCPEPDCPPVKTMIIVFRPGAPTESIAVHKPAREVRLSDIRTAIGCKKGDTNV
jgi:hypothetical protein